MGRQDEIVKERLRKIAELKSQGINPYLSKYPAEDVSSELQKHYKNLKFGEKSKGKAKVAGRIMSIRDIGKITFANLLDGNGKIQIVLQDGETPEKIRTFFKKYIDEGDFAGVDGTIFRTVRGELSVLVNDAVLMTKSILPMPEKWHGLQDEEEKLRKRYLDILMNPEVCEMFIRKAKFWQTIRAFLQEKGFLEVETPILENSAGGASATPFVTHHNALDIDVFLRISMGELWQKKLMVSGYRKTFEIGRQFRNEGMDAEHLQDYTQMEFYWGYANYEDGMALVEEMYKKIAKEVFGKIKFNINNQEVNIDANWKKIDYADTIKKETGIDIFDAKTSELESKLSGLRQEFIPGSPRARLIDILWKYCRRKITGPVFLIGQPVEVSPLAKRSSKDPRKVEQFQVIIAGSEMGNGYSELNDPIDQEARFSEQQKMKESGDKEAQSHDFEFVEALKYGMPPTCGFGVSERLFAFFEGKPIRETVIFPLMKPLHSKKTEFGESKETKVAVAIVNKGAKLEPWEQMNTIAHLNAAFGAREGKKLFYQDKIKTKDNQEINLNIQHAIMIKETDDNNELRDVIYKAKEQGLEVSEFTGEMISTTNDKQVIDFTSHKNHQEIEYLGVLIFGNKKKVESLTNSFNLFNGFLKEDKKKRKK